MKQKYRHLPTGEEFFPCSEGTTYECPGKEVFFLGQDALGKFFPKSECRKISSSWEEQPELKRLLLKEARGEFWNQNTFGSLGYQRKHYALYAVVGGKLINISAKCSGKETGQVADIKRTPPKKNWKEELTRLGAEGILVDVSFSSNWGTSESWNDLIFYS